jgi:hypothetical protein
MPTKVDESKDVVEIKVVMNIKWIDKRLAWDKSVYPIDKTTFTTEKGGIWIPDNSIWFGADMKTDFMDWE